MEAGFAGGLPRLKVVPSSAAAAPVAKIGDSVSIPGQSQGPRRSAASPREGRGIALLALHSFMEDASSPQCTESSNFLPGSSGTLFDGFASVDDMLMTLMTPLADQHSGSCQSQQHNMFAWPDRAMDRASHNQLQHHTVTTPSGPHAGNPGGGQAAGGIKRSNSLRWSSALDGVHTPYAQPPDLQLPNSHNYPLPTAPLQRLPSLLMAPSSPPVHLVPRRVSRTLSGGFAAARPALPPLRTLSMNLSKLAVDTPHPFHNTNASPCHPAASWAQQQQQHQQDRGGHAVADQHRLATTTSQPPQPFPTNTSAQPPSVLRARVILAPGHTHPSTTPTHAPHHQQHPGHYHTRPSAQAAALAAMCVAAAAMPMPCVSASSGAATSESAGGVLVKAAVASQGAAPRRQRVRASSSRRRWGAAQLHPQQAEVDALVNAGQQGAAGTGAMSHAASDYLERHGSATTPGSNGSTADALPAACNATSAAAATTLANPSPHADSSKQLNNGTRNAVPRRLSGGILTAAIRQNVWARAQAAPPPSSQAKRQRLRPAEASGAAGPDGSTPGSGPQPLPLSLQPPTVRPPATAGQAMEVEVVAEGGGVAAAGLAAGQPELPAAAPAPDCTGLGTAAAHQPGASALAAGPATAAGLSTQGSQGGGAGLAPNSQPARMKRKNSESLDQAPFTPASAATPTTPAAAGTAATAAAASAEPPETTSPRASVMNSLSRAASVTTMNGLSRAASATTMLDPLTLAPLQHQHRPAKRPAPAPRAAPPMVRGIVAGILAEARSLTGRGPLLLRPEAVLEAAAAAGTVAALSALSEDRISQLLDGCGGPAADHPEAMSHHTSLPPAAQQLYMGGELGNAAAAAAPGLAGGGMFRQGSEGGGGRVAREPLAGTPLSGGGGSGWGRMGCLAPAGAPFEGGGGGGAGDGDDQVSIGEGLSWLGEAHADEMALIEELLIRPHLLQTGPGDGVGLMMAAEDRDLMAGMTSIDDFLR